MTNVSSVTQYRQEGQTPGGTVTYIAPERYQSVTYGTEDGKEKREIAKKSDVFSYGILLWEIKERDRPYEGRYTYVGCRHQVIVFYRFFL